MNKSEPIVSGNLITAGKVDLIPWPESQGCVGCSFANLVHQSSNVGSSAYICLIKDRTKVLCDNPEMQE